jgi:hypothetical protein
LRTEEEKKDSKTAVCVSKILEGGGGCMNERVNGWERAAV